MSSNTPSANMQHRALGAMLSSAFFTWPSAVTIAFFLGMFILGIHLPFDFWQPWLWLPVGIVAEGAYLYATLTDPEAGRQAVERMLTEQYNPATIRNSLARQRVESALKTKALIDKFIQSQDGGLKASLEQTTSEMNDWIGQIYRLARNIDTFESNNQFDQGLRTLPSEIANLRNRLSLETDPGVRDEVNQAIQIRQQLLANLDSIGNMAKRAELQMDNTLTQLGTIYTQMQLIDVKALDSNRSQRLRQDIHDQISSLSDTISAMDDVYHKNSTYDNSVNTLAGDPSTSSATAAASDIAAKRMQGGGQSR
jgi:hypothetical protein